MARRQLPQRSFVNPETVFGGNNHGTTRVSFSAIAHPRDESDVPVDTCGLTTEEAAHAVLMVDRMKGWNDLDPIVRFFGERGVLVHHVNQTLRQEDRDGGWAGFDDGRFHRRPEPTFFEFEIVFDGHLPLYDLWKIIQEGFPGAVCHSSTHARRADRGW